MSHWDCSIESVEGVEKRKSRKEKRVFFKRPNVRLRLGKEIAERSSFSRALLVKQRERESAVEFTNRETARVYKVIKC